LGRAADLHESLPIALHFDIVCEPGHHILQNSSGVSVGRLNDSIVHPLTLTPCVYDSGAPQVRQVPADLGLVRLQYLHQETDTHLVAAYQIQQPQTRPIGQRAKEHFLIKQFRLSTHTPA